MQQFSVIQDARNAIPMGQAVYLDQSKPFEVGTSEEIKELLNNNNSIPLFAAWFIDENPRETGTPIAAIKMHWFSYITADPKSLNQYELKPFGENL